VLLAGCDRFVSSYSRTSKASDPSAVASQGQTEVNQQRMQGQEEKQDSQRDVQTMGGEHMNKRCKHVRQDGFNCGSYAFNLYKDDIDQGDLCDVHYWQAKAQRTWVGLTDEEVDKAWRSVDYTVPWEQHRIDIAKAIEAKLKEKNNA
jgi:hypothetical protein